MALEQNGLVICGTMKFTCWGKKTFSSGEALQFLRECLANGINTFDTADIYGHYTVEALLGEALSLDPSLRPKIKIITKCGINLPCNERPQYHLKSYDSSPQHIFESVSTSLKALRTDYIDLLLIHRPDPLTHPSQVASALTSLLKKGSVLSVGVSNYSPAQFEALDGFMRKEGGSLATNQIQFSVLHTQPLEDGSFEYLMQKGIRPQIWSPLGGNALLFDPETTDPKIVRLRGALQEIANKHHSEMDVIALSWVLAHPSEPSVVIGTTDMSRVKRAKAAESVKITREEWYQLWEASRGQEIL